jgi:hypothetical protein
MAALDQLQHSNPDARAFHSRLSEILRLYVYRRKGILSLQKTTGDLVVQLASSGLQKTVFDRLSQSLRLGDLVKFARFSPTEAENLAAYEAVRESIKELEQIEKAKFSTTEKTG